jgi:ornithine carbamoyltransferase
MPLSLKGRHFLTLKDFTEQEIYYLLDLAIQLKAKKRAGIRGNLLQGKNIALLFEKSSTRTRCAFTVACIDEGGHAEYLGKNDIHLGGKEDVKDTARVLGRMFDGIEYRGFKQSFVEELAAYAGVPVWNGLTDTYHPTQILADFLTLQENFGTNLQGLRLVYAGDGNNNSSYQFLKKISPLCVLGSFPMFYICPF